MGWIMKSMRKMQLKHEVSNLELQDVKISRQMQDLANFANNIGDGVITFSEMTDCPSSLFGTQLGFMQNSSQAAYQSATVKTNAYLQQLAATNGVTGNQYGYAMGTTNNMGYDTTTIFNEIYKEELKQYSEQMQDYLNSYEEELQEEKTRIETQLQAKEAELQAYEQSISEDIQENAIKL